MYNVNAAWMYKCRRFILVFKISRPSPSHFHCYYTSSYFVMDVKDMYAEKEAEEQLKEQVKQLDELYAEKEAEKRMKEQVKQLDLEFDRAVETNLSGKRQFMAVLDTVNDRLKYWKNRTEFWRDQFVHWTKDLQKLLEAKDVKIAELQKLLEAKDVKIAELQSNAIAVQQVRNEVMLQVQHNLDKVSANVAEIQNQVEDDAQDVL